MTNTRRKMDGVTPGRQGVGLRARRSRSGAKAQGDYNESTYSGDRSQGASFH